MLSFFLVASKCNGSDDGGAEEPKTASKVSSDSTKSVPVDQRVLNSQAYGLVTIGALALMSLLLGVFIYGKLNKLSERLRYQASPKSDSSFSNNSNINSSIQSMNLKLSGLESYLAKDNLRQLVLEINNELLSTEYLRDAPSLYPNVMLENQKTIIAMLKEENIPKPIGNSQGNIGTQVSTPKLNHNHISDPSTLLRDYNEAIIPRSSSDWQGFINKYDLKAMSYSADTRELFPNEMGMLAACRFNGEYRIIPSNRFRTIDQSTVEQYKNVFDLEGDVFSQLKLSDFKLLDAAMARNDDAGKIVLQRKGRMKRIT
ncbi:MAG: hypothetical protein PHV91_01250 [Bacteroidales bacterium]|jgi:hypothetical protein|nr:hypothetical protein [Bacteroidales bacterium]